MAQPTKMHRHLVTSIMKKNLLVATTIILVICKGPSASVAQITPPVCNYTDGRSYVAVAGADIIAGAEECFRLHNGTVYETRVLSETLALMTDLESKNCWSSTLRPYTAPTSWEFQDALLALNSASLLAYDELPAEQVPLYWKYADGTPLTKTLFRAGEPNYAKTQYCARPESGGLACIGCSGRPVLCIVNAPDQLKSCPRHPRNPTAESLPEARISYVHQNTTFLPLLHSGIITGFPQGAMAELTCPYGYRWSPTTRALLYQGANNTRRAKCLGSLNWATHDLTTCIPDADLTVMNQSTILKDGVASTTRTPFLGNHTDAAIACHSLNPNSTVLAAPKNAIELEEVNKFLFESGVKGDVAVGTNILHKVRMSEMNESLFLTAWNLLIPDASIWHVGEPSWNSSKVAACAVLTSVRSAGYDWKLASRSCSEPFNTSATVCIAGPRGSKCLLNDFQRPKMNLNLSSSQDLEDNGFQQTAIYRAGCGYRYINATSPNQSFKSKCFGGFGWFPLDIPDSVPLENSIRLTIGTNVTLLLQNMSLSSPLDAERKCHLSLASDYGLPKFTSTDASFTDVYNFLDAHCISGPLPVAWNVIKDNGVLGNSTAYMTAWTSPFQDFPPNLTWAPGQPLFSSGNPALCASMERNSNNQWELSSVSCENLSLNVTGILCQGGTGGIDHLICAG